MHLQLDYLNQEKLDPKILLVGALTELERVIPELSVSTEFNPDKKKQNLNIFYGNEIAKFQFLELNGLLELKTVLQRVLSHLTEKKINLTKLQIEKTFINGILNRLDGYSVLLSSEIYRDFNINIDGHFAGVGLVVGMLDGHLTVISPIDGGPAERAGIQPLDRIVAVDKEKTEYLTLEEILQRLRGNLGSIVNLSVFRKGNINELNFVLEREEIRVESVEKFDLNLSGMTIRYIRINNFQIGTSKELENKISDLNGIDGLILDLRNNPGGLLEEAVKISDLFLSGKHIIVSTKGPSVSKIHESKKFYLGELYERVPIAVLINRGSASASEIVAAALKQNDRAILIGEKSFGKGTVQSLWRLKDGSGLKLTVGEYLTPSGNSIQDIGVNPSIFLNPVYIFEDNKNLKKMDKAIKGLARNLRLIRESELFNKDKNIETHSISYLGNNKNKYNSTEKIDENLYHKLKSDIFIRVAVIAIQYPNRKKINHNLNKKIRELEFNENKKIYARLSELGIDWSKNELEKINSPYNLNLKWEAEKIGPGILNLKVQIHNVGNQKANRLIVITKASNVLLDGLEFPIGEVLPGESRSYHVKVNFSSRLMEETEPVEIILLGQHNRVLKSMRKNLKFLSRRNPLFKFKTKMFDNGKLGSKGNGDGQIQVGETIALSFQIVNLSEEIVQDFLLKIRGYDGNFRINRGKINIKNMVPGIQKNDFFLFQVLGGSNKMGKIKMEMLDTKSGMPKIVRKWELNQDFREQSEVIPRINFLKLYDDYGNLIEGETSIKKVFLKIEVDKSSKLEDLYVHLNGKKIFYSVSEKNINKSGYNSFKKNEFIFVKGIKLTNGKNNISVYARNSQGTVSERRIKVIFRE